MDQSSEKWWPEENVCRDVFSRSTKNESEKNPGPAGISRLQTQICNGRRGWRREFHPLEKEERFSLIVSIHRTIYTLSLVVHSATIKLKNKYFWPTAD